MVYLIHLDEPVGRARHYLGWALDADKRFAEHRAGKGGRLTRAAAGRGIGITLARVWPEGDRSLEARLRKVGGYKLLCPLCGGR